MLKQNNTTPALRNAQPAATSAHISVSSPPRPQAPITPSTFLPPLRITAHELSGRLDDQTRRDRLAGRDQPHPLEPKHDTPRVARGGRGVGGGACRFGRQGTPKSTTTCDRRTGTCTSTYCSLKESPYKAYLYGDFCCGVVALLIRRCKSRSTDMCA